MKVTYDKEADAIYIRFKKEKVWDSDEDKHGEMIIDYGIDGSIIGIEVLNVSSKLSLPMQVDYTEL